MRILQHIEGPILAGYGLSRVRRKFLEHTCGVLVSLGVVLDPLQVCNLKPSVRVLHPELLERVERVVPARRVAFLELPDRGNS